MNPLTFDELARLPLLQNYEEAFRKGTGVALKLFPPDEPRQRMSFGQCENAFCALVACTPAGCEACREIQGRLHRNTAGRLVAQRIDCFAGLTEIAVPVVVDGRHVATLMSGQVFRRVPTQRDFDMLVKMLGEGLNGGWEKKARKAYFETPVFPMEKFQAIVELLTVFARHLPDEARLHSIVCSGFEPSAVSSAKEFIQSHATESITLDEVLQHVHVSRFYFCKIFKKTTGVTLTEYVARVRVENAKQMLGDPSLRISEVVFAAGFGSIPQFNSVFKRFVGMPPTEYRVMQRKQSLQ